LTSNKKTDIEANKTSNTFFASVKAIYDWAVGLFQPILVSGTNIKTINNTSLLGSGDIQITSQYTINQTPNNGAYNLLIGLVDGINSLFTVSDGSYLTGALSVYLDGQLMTQGVANDYTETNPATGTFTFVTPPPVGSIITASYISDPSIVGIGVTGWKTTTIENITLTAANWVLNSGFYEYDYANAAILVDSVIEIIPYNSTIETVRQAEIMPMVISGVGTVKLYAKNLPSNNILIALNIQK